MGPAIKTNAANDAKSHDLRDRLERLVQVALKVHVHDSPIDRALHGFIQELH
jgi:hypothetical protein